MPSPQDAGGPVLNLEERAEFLRRYCQVYPHARPVPLTAWCDALLVDWYRDRGPGGLPRELAFLALESHPDCDLHLGRSCGCTPDEAWQRLALAAQGSTRALTVLVAAVARDIRVSADDGSIDRAFAALGRLVSVLDRSDPDQLLIRNACQRLHARWNAERSADPADPRYAALRSDAERLLSDAECEAQVPRASQLSPTVSHEHYVCFHHLLVAEVAARYRQVFVRALPEPAIFTGYLFGYDGRFLSYTMDQTGKYGEDPRAIAARRSRGAIPPWRPFAAEHADILAARIAACMRWIIDAPLPDADAVERLARELVALPAYGA